MERIGNFNDNVHALMCRLWKLNYEKLIKMKFFTFFHALSWFMTFFMPFVDHRLWVRKEFLIVLVWFVHDEGRTRWICSFISNDENFELLVWYFWCYWVEWTQFWGSLVILHLFKPKNWGVNPKLTKFYLNNNFNSKNLWMSKKWLSQVKKIPEKSRRTDHARNFHALLC